MLDEVTEQLQQKACVSVIPPVQEPLQSHVLQHIHALHSAEHR